LLHKLSNVATATAVEIGSDDERLSAGTDADAQPMRLASTRTRHDSLIEWSVSL